MANSTQIRDLFRRVHHPQLKDTFKAIKVRVDLDGIKYSEVANHLTASVSNMPEYQLSRKFSGIHTRGSNSGGGGLHKGDRNIGSIYNSQGNIHTRCYHNWKGRSK